MPFLALVPVLADLDVSFIIVIIIGFITWLVNLANQKKQAPKPGRKPPVRDKRLSNEIDNFLQEVRGKARQAEPVDIEIVPENELRQRRRREKPRHPLRQQQQTEVKPKPRAPGAEMSERHAIDPSRLGEGLQSHLREYMDDDRLDQEVTEHLAHNVDRSVDEHLGSFSGDDVWEETADDTTIGPPQSAQDIVGLLNDPDGVRKAILISEVLAPPLGRRNR